MSKITINTDKIKEAGENIVKASEEFNTVIDEIFTKLKNVEKDGAWVGDNENSSAKKYIESVTKDKQQYSDYAVSINHFGKQIIAYAADINSVAGDKIKEGLCQ